MRLIIEFLSRWSLPSRERGLKLDLLLALVMGLRSLPSRERGLKLTEINV